MRVFPWADSNRRPNALLGSSGDTSCRCDLLGIKFDHVCFPRFMLVLGKASKKKKKNRVINFALGKGIKKDEAKSMTTSTLSDQNSLKEDAPP